MDGMVVDAGTSWVKVASEWTDQHVSAYSAESFQQIPIGLGPDILTQIDDRDLLVAHSAVLMHNRWMLVRSFRSYSSTRCPKPMKTRPTNSQSQELLPTVSAKTSERWISKGVSNPDNFKTEISTYIHLAWNICNLQLAVHWPTPEPFSRWVKILPKTVGWQEWSIKQHPVPHFMLLSTISYFCSLSFILWIGICDRWTPEPFTTIMSTTIAFYMCGIISLVVWEGLWLLLPVHTLVHFMIVHTIIVIIRQLFTCFNIAHSIHSNMWKPLVCGFYINSIYFQIRIATVPQITTNQVSEKLW